MKAPRLTSATPTASSDRKAPAADSPLLDAFYAASAEMVAGNPVAIMLTWEDAKGVLHNVTIPDLNCVYEGMKARLVREPMRK